MQDRLKSGASRDILIRTSASGRGVCMGPLRVTLLVEAADGVGLAVVLFEAAAGAVAPPQLHANTREDWCALICGGEMAVGTSDGERRAGFEQFFPDAAAVGAQAGGMPPEPARLGSLLMPLWRRYGVSQL